MVRMCFTCGICSGGDDTLRFATHSYTSEETGEKLHACAPHAKEVKRYGIETEEVEQELLENA